MMVKVEGKGKKKIDALPSRGHQGKVASFYMGLMSWNVH